MVTDRRRCLFFTKRIVHSAAPVCNDEGVEAHGNGTRTLRSEGDEGQEVSTGR